jgi:hypothetical protein
MAIAYFEQNPDVAAAYAQKNKYGLSPEEFASAHYELYGRAEQRQPPSGSVVTDYQGNQFNTNDLKTLANQVYQSFDPTSLSGGVFGTQNENIGFDEKQLASALNTKDLSTAEQVAFDMARQLLLAGVKDINAITPQTTTNPYEMRIDSEGSNGLPSYGERLTGGTLYGDVGSNILTFGSSATGEGQTHYQLVRDPATGALKIVTGGVSTSDADMIKALAQAAALMYGGYLGETSALDAASQEALKAAESYAQSGTLTAADLASQFGIPLEEASTLLTGSGGYLNAASVDQLLQQYGDEALKAAEGYEQTGTLTAQDLANQLGIPVEEVAKILPPGTILPGIPGATNASGFIGEGAQSGVTQWDQAMPATPSTPMEPTTPSTPATTPSTPSTPSLPSGLLTPSNISTFLKALAAAGATGALTTGGGGGSMPVGALPTQGIPQNTPEYFQAVQQSYNQLMPAAPRNVAGPLEQWYNTKYGS